MIAEPPSAGATQVIKMFVPEFEVVGAAGVVGAFGSDAPFPDEE